MAVGVLSMRSRACFWAGLRGIRDFFSRGRLDELEGGVFRRFFSRPFGRIAEATEGRGFR